MDHAAPKGIYFSYYRLINFSDIFKNNSRKKRIFSYPLPLTIDRLHRPVNSRSVDTGEITASCMGPTQTARCQLFDHHNRTYTVRIFPTEAGRHTLNITYDKEHVPGRCKT